MSHTATSNQDPELDRILADINSGLSGMRDYLRVIEEQNNAETRRLSLMRLTIGLLFFGLVFSCVLLLLGLNVVLFCLIALAVNTLIIAAITVLSKHLARAFTGAKDADSNDKYSYVKDMLIDLTERAKKINPKLQIKVPKLYVFDGPINAFASGFSRNNATVTVSTKLLKLFEDDPEALKAILAHELGHVRNRDIFVIQLMVFVTMAALTILPNLPEILGLTAAAAVTFPALTLPAITLFVITFAAGIILSNVIVASVSFFITRRREYLADKASYELLGSSEPLQRGLKKIQAETDTYIEENKGSLGLFTRIKLWLSKKELWTHPTTNNRIKRLQKMSNLSQSDINKSLVKNEILLYAILAIVPLSFTLLIVNPVMLPMIVGVIGISLIKIPLVAYVATYTIAAIGFPTASIITFSSHVREFLANLICGKKTSQQAPAPATPADRSTAIPSTPATPKEVDPKTTVLDGPDTLPLNTPSNTLPKSTIHG